MQKITDAISGKLAFFPPTVSSPPPPPFDVQVEAVCGCAITQRVLETSEAVPCMPIKLQRLCPAPVQPPSYKLAQHGDGGRETYIQPQRRQGGVPQFLAVQTS
jgi:hypothetical protein